MARGWMGSGNLAAGIGSTTELMFAFVHVGRRALRMHETVMWTGLEELSWLAGSCPSKPLKIAIDLFSHF